MHARLPRTLAKFVIAFVLAVCIGSCATTSTQLSTPVSGVQRMFVFNCGESTVSDVSRWTPGVNVGKPGARSMIRIFAEI